MADTTNIKFSDPKIRSWVNSDNFEMALENGTKDDIRPILKSWLIKYAPNVDSKDDRIIDLLYNWYVFFQTITDKANPFFDYLKSTKDIKVNPKYNDLVAINNKYQENILEDSDLHKGQGKNKVLDNYWFYGKDFDSQNYWLDIYAFLSDENKVKSALSPLPIDYTLQIGDNERYSRSELAQDTKLRDVVLFVGGNPKGQIRDPRQIENILNGIAKYQTTKSKGYRNVNRLTKFIKDNPDLVNDPVLANDVLLYLSED